MRGVPRHAQAEGVHPARVVPVQGLEGGLVARLGAPDDVGHEDVMPGRARGV